MNEKTKQHWNDWSDEYYKSFYHDSILDTIQNDPSHAFPAETFEMIKRVFPDLSGKRVLVASSGDNVAVLVSIYSARTSHRPIYPKDNLRMLQNSQRQGMED